MTLAERLKQLRKEKGLTQEQLGKVIGVQKQAIWKYENGNVTNMKSSTIKTLAEYFNVSPSYLMGYTNVRNPETQENLSEFELKAIELLRMIPEDKRDGFLEYLKSAIQIIL